MVRGSWEWQPWNSMEESEQTYFKAISQQQGKKDEKYENLG